MPRSELNWSIPLAGLVGLGIAVLLSFQGSPVGPTVAFAATLTVDTLNDADSVDGFCSLREAIIAANADSDHNECVGAGPYGADLINFGVAGTIGLAGELPILTDNVSILGPGESSLTLDAQGNGRIFDIDPSTDVISGMTLINGDVASSAGAIFIAANASVTLSNVTINDGSSDNQGGGIVLGGTAVLNNVTMMSNMASGAGTNDLGGAIYVAGTGMLTLNDSLISGNTADEQGGGIYNDGGLVTLNRSSVAGNTSGDDGGGIYSNGGTVNLTDSTIDDNRSVTANGGGIYNDAGTLTIVRSTISNNLADGSGNGGGIFTAFSADATLTNSTVSGNQASDGGDGLGGGIFNSSTARLTLTNVTVTNNTGSSGGIENGGQVASITLANTIVAGNNGPDCTFLSGTLQYQGQNLDGDGTCGVTTGNAGLGPLQDNGGPTLTHELLAGSQAIDAADDAICAASPVDGEDQRGLSRPRDGDNDGTAICDIGAYEFGVAPEPEPSPSPEYIPDPDPSQFPGPGGTIVPLPTQPPPTATSAPASNVGAITPPSTGDAGLR